MAGFLEALVETASVSVAAKSVGMTRQSAYRLRARLIGQPFDHAWAAALEFGLQQLHHEALDRAMNGVPHPIFYAGEQVGERRIYPDGLTRFLLDNPNARAVARDADLGTAALSIWDTMVQRVQKGPAKWTPAEARNAESLARDILCDDDAADDPRRTAKRRSSRDKLDISNREYQLLAEKLCWKIV